MKRSISLKIDQNLDASIKKCLTRTNQSITDFFVDALISKIIMLCKDQNNDLLLQEIFAEHIKKEAINLASYWRSQNNVKVLSHILAVAMCQYENKSGQKDLIHLLSDDGKKVTKEGLRNSLEIDAKGSEESKVEYYDSIVLLNFIIDQAMELLMGQCQKEVELLPWEDKEDLQAKIIKIDVLIKRKHVIAVGFDEDEGIVLRSRYDSIDNKDKEKIEEQLKEFLNKDYGIDVTDIYVWE